MSTNQCACKKNACDSQWWDLNFGEPVSQSVSQSVSDRGWSLRCYRIEENQTRPTEICEPNVPVSYPSEAPLQPCQLREELYLPVQRHKVQ